MKIELDLPNSRKEHEKPLPVFGNNPHACMYVFRSPGMVDEKGNFHPSQQLLCFHNSKWFLDNPIDKTCPFKTEEEACSCPGYTKRRMDAPDDGHKLKILDAKAKGTGFIE